tara:strand:- start:875 stop:1540 length:666 start_codon:yes stop_codon:yes gene_type:complete
MQQLQRWLSIRDYSSDYLNLVYNYYAAAGISYTCTYYNFDFPNSAIDKEMLDAGAFETTGEFSGNRWRKILLLPIYNVEQISNVFGNDERGVGKFEQASSFNIPSIYRIQPSPMDFVYFEETVLNDPNKKSDFVQPLYQVTNFEKATNTDRTFWKLGIAVSDHKPPELDTQLSGHYTFFDYEKKIYKTEDAVEMFKLLDKNKEIPLNDYYNERCGLHFLNK